MIDTGCPDAGCTTTKVNNKQTNVLSTATTNTPTNITTNKRIIKNNTQRHTRCQTRVAVVKNAEPPNFPPNPFNILNPLDALNHLNLSMNFFPIGVEALLWLFLLVIKVSKILTGSHRSHYRTLDFSFYSFIPFSSLFLKVSLQPIIHSGWSGKRSPSRLCQLSSNVTGSWGPSGCHH